MQTASELQATCSIVTAHARQCKGLSNATSLDQCTGLLAAEENSVEKHPSSFEFLNIFI